MNNTYILNSWPEASKMINKLDPNRKIVVTILKNLSETIGHKIVIIDDNLTFPSNVLCSFYINYAEEGFYSVDDDEAVNILNQFGFNCEYHEREYNLPEEVIKKLTGLKDLGYKLIIRKTKPHLDLIILKEVSEELISKIRAGYYTYTKVDSMYRLSADEVNYYDYRFLEVDQPTMIDSILNSTVYNS